MNGTERSNGSAGDACHLCDLPTPDPPITADDVAGVFCCRGCLQVHRALGDVDVDPVDLQRESIKRGDWGEEPASGIERAFLAVDGMHCSTCEAFLEARGESIDGVERARASYASDTVKLEYDPESVTAGDLAEQLSGYGYAARDRNEGVRSDHRDAALVRFLLGGGLFGMMVMVWYVLFLYPTYFGYEPVVDLGGYDGLYLFGQIWLMTSLVLFYTGYPILRGAWVSLLARRPNMDLLVSTAALAAYAYSTLAMLVGRTDLYFDVSVTIVLVVTVGTWYERRVKRRSLGLLRNLTEASVDEARVIARNRAADGGVTEDIGENPTGSDETTKANETRTESETTNVEHENTRGSETATKEAELVPVEDVSPGDRVLVRAGERVPLDGRVVEGTAAVDESLLTGEALPVTRTVGDEVRGGTLVTDAPVVVAVGSDGTSTLDRLVALLWDIQSATPGVQRLADRLATIFVPLVLVLATLATGLSLWSGVAVAESLLIGLTVLIVSCPCALGVATPLAIASGVRSAAERGVVLASEHVFETAPAADVVVFDKTGTLTTGEMTVRSVETHPDESEARLLDRAATLERVSAHPIAAAIVDHVADEDRSRSTDEDRSERPDGHCDPDVEPDGGEAATAVAVADVEERRRGVTGVVDGDVVVVGHPSLFDERDWTLPEVLAEAVDEIRTAGDVPVVVGWTGRARGVITVGDEPRPGWREAVERLAEERSVTVLTGDEGPSADRYREVDGVDEVFAGVPPEGKAETVRRLRSRGTVAMVGDGSNDAPALAAADLGVALGSGTALASDAADAVLTTDDVRTVPSVFDLASGTKRRIRENLAWAFVYNGIAIPLALTGILNPLLAAVAMATSSALVVVNSSRPILR